MRPDNYGSQRAQNFINGTGKDSEKWQETREYANAKQEQESNDPIDDILVQHGVSKTRKEMLLPRWKDYIDGSINVAETIFSPSGKGKALSKYEKILEAISKAGDLAKLVNQTNDTYNKQVLYDYSRARLSDLTGYYNILQGIHQNVNCQLNEYQEVYNNLPVSVDKQANANNRLHYGKQIYRLSDKLDVVSQEINAVKILIHAREEERKIQN